MISVRFLKPKDVVRMRTQCKFYVLGNKRLFDSSETRLAIYEIVLSSATTEKQYVVWYYEDGRAFEPYNYCRDIVYCEEN